MYHKTIKEKNNPCRMQTMNSTYSYVHFSLIESVESINRGERGFPLTIHYNWGNISR